MAHVKTVSRYHDISCGHRVVGHEGKCRFLHGHNYRIHFECYAPATDAIGRVVDFSVIKSKLCMWVENNWDHRTLLWQEDPLWIWLGMVEPASDELSNMLDQSLIQVPFNPTAENMAAYLLENIGQAALKGTGVTLTRVTIDETRKCSASVSLIN